MSVQKKIRLVSTNDEELGNESEAIQEALGRIEAENALELATHARARAEALARAIAEGKLRHENELLALLDVKSRTDLLLLNEVQIRIELEREYIVATNEKAQLETSLINETKDKIHAANHEKSQFEIRLGEEQISHEAHEKAAKLHIEAKSLAQEKAKHEAQIAEALATQIRHDKESLSLLNGKLIAETARAEGAKQVVLHHEEAIACLKQAELEESEVIRLEMQAKQIAHDRIDSVQALKVAAQQRVAIELLATQGIETQLKAEHEAVMIAKNREKIARAAKQAADDKIAYEKEFAEQSERSIEQDSLAVKQFDHHLQLINDRIKIAEQQAFLMGKSCLAEEQKLALETAVVDSERERISIENSAIDALNKKLALEQALLKTAKLRRYTENKAIAEISIRMDVELKAIEADNARITLEVAATEILEAQLRVEEELVASAKIREETEMHTLRVAKLRADSEAQAIQAEAELLQAHTYANKLAQQHYQTARNLQQFIDERINDERFYLELENKVCAAEMQRRNAIKSRKESEQHYLEEVEKRIVAENQVALVSNQHQIAEHRARQVALNKWKSEKQALLDMNNNPEFEQSLISIPGNNLHPKQITLN